MTEASIGESRPRPCSGRKTLKKCKSNGVSGKAVVIDVENDDFANVIDLEVPESLSKKLRASSSRKEKRSTWSNVIYIDDDESIENNHPDVGVNENVNFPNGASSSSPDANNDGNFSDAVGDECQFVQENISPVKISNRKRTYSGKSPAGNRFGLDSDTEIDSSDDDFADCELVEDPVGRLREEWEKANWKRKCENRNVQSDFWAFNDRSTFPPNFQQGVGVESMPGQHEEATECSGSGKTSCERDDPSPSNVTGDSPRHSSSNSRFSDFPFKAQFPCTNADVEESAINLGQKEDFQYFEHRGPISQNGLGTRSHFRPRGKETAEQVSHVCRDYGGRERTPSMEPCISNNGNREQIFGNGEADLEEEVQPESSKFVEEEELPQAEPPYMSAGISNEQINLDFAPSRDQVESIPDNFCGKSPLNSGVRMGEIHHPENGELFNEKLTSCRNTCTNEAQLQHENSISQDSEEELATSVSNGQQENPDDVDHSNDGEIVHETVTCIINDREKLKQTDEYKRAVEEEWAARQQALQIQAEEAQQSRRLLKRRKAEQLRILDMERRQKQRLEEIRESQKKDEEHMNLKELIRAEIRSQLSKLELECKDMASLLRSLGINVGGMLKPLQHEVRAACKRALFTFHPDRASKCDIRQQVESEEKFKLISRMKEKFLLT